MSLGDVIRGGCGAGKIEHREELALNAENKNKHLLVCEPGYELGSEPGEVPVLSTL
jgi:hypothetical protein